MGFFDFLKSKRKPEPPALEEIGLEEIDSWISEQYESAYNKIKSTLDDYQTQVSQEKQTLKEKIEALRIAEIKNKKIPDRAVQAMEGNRETYIIKLSTFIDKLDFPSSPGEIENFHNEFDKNLNNFEKTVARNHAVVEQFFGEKAGAIPASMKKIDRLIKEAQIKVKESELRKIQELQGKVESFHKTIKRKNELKKEIDYAQEVLKKSSEKIEEQEKSLENLQTSKDYSTFLSLEKEKEFLEKQISEHESKLQHSFSEIETALKKYENLSQNKIAKDYLENPLAALNQDTQLEITKILNAALTAIKHTEITIKDKKREKIITELSSLTQEYFSTFKQKQQELNSKLAEINSKLSSIEITQKISQLKEEISHNKIKLKDSKLDFHEKQKDFEKIEPDELKTELEQQINSTLENKKIKII